MSPDRNGQAPRGSIRAAMRRARDRAGLVRDTRAVSDVVGSILLVGITVVMAAGLGLLLLSYDGPTDEQHTQLALTVGPGSDGDWANGAELRITHLGGESLRQSQVSVRYTDAVGAQTVTPTFAGGTLRIGQSWTVNITAFPGDIVPVSVVSRSGSGGTIIANGEVPAGETATVVLTYVSNVVGSPAFGSVANLTDAKAAGDSKWATILEGGVGAPITQTTMSPAANTSSGATNPGNILSSNDQRAVLDASGEFVQGQSFSGLPGNATSVSQVVMRFEGRGIVVQPVTLVQEVNVTTGGLVTSVTATGVTATNGLVYLAAVAYGADTNPNRTVVVSGHGLTWTAVQQAATGSANTDHGRLEVWVGTGTPSGSTVTATFSGAIETASDSILWVSSWSGVNTTAPVEASSQNMGSPTSGVSTWSTAAVTGSQNGRFIAVANVVTAATVDFNNPAEQGEVDKDNVHLGWAHAAAAVGSNAASGTLANINIRWQVVALTLRAASPAVPVMPTVNLTYHLSGGPAGPTSLSQLLTASDVNYTRDITTDRSWTVADIGNLGVRVTAPSVSGATVEIDHISVTVTTAAGTTTFRLDVVFDWPSPAQVSTTATNYLQVRYQTAVDTFTLQVWNGTAYRTCAALNSPSNFSEANCLLTVAEANGGIPRMRLTDDTPAGTTQGTVLVDYARVRSS